MDNIELLNYSDICRIMDDGSIKLMLKNVSMEILQKIVGDIATLIRNGKTITSSIWETDISSETMRKLNLRDRVTAENPIIYLLEQEIDLSKFDFAFELNLDKIRIESNGEVVVRDFELIKKALNIKNKDVKLSFEIYDIQMLQDVISLLESKNMNMNNLTINFFPRGIFERR